MCVCEYTDVRLPDSPHYFLTVCVVAACDGAEQRRRDHQEQLQAAGGRVPPPAAHHCVSTAQQLQTETESQAGVEALQEPQVQDQDQTKAHSTVGCPLRPRLHLVLISGQTFGFKGLIQILQLNTSVLK